MFLGNWFTWTKGDVFKVCAATCISACCVVLLTGAPSYGPDEVTILSSIFHFRLLQTSPGLRNLCLTVQVLWNL